MERALYSSLRVLDRIRSFPASDWRKQLVCDPDTINVISIGKHELSRLLQLDESIEEGTVRSIVRKYYNTCHPSKDEMLLLEDGIYENEELMIIHTLDSLCEMFGDERLKYCQNPQPEAYINGIILQDEETDLIDLKKKGILVYDVDAGPDLALLTDEWKDLSDPDDNAPFSWDSFLCHPLPPSNSALIIDRYLFQVKEGKNGDVKKWYYAGINNVVDLLKVIIPNDFEGQYFVTLVFEYNQLGDHILDALNEINYRIRQNLKERMAIHKSKLTLSYIAIKDPKNQESAKLDAWKNLHNLFHDRDVYTNYYWVFATGALNVSAKDKHASRWQKVFYEAILHGVNNPRQKLSSIPLYIEAKSINKFYSFIKAAPFDSYQCFIYNNDDKRVNCCEEQFIRNNLFSLR